MNNYINTTISLATLLIFSGCVSTNRTSVHDFPNIGLTVVQTDHDGIQSVCKTDMLDDGTAPEVGATYWGCAMQHIGLIYINRDCRSPSLLLHEICHFDDSRTALECKEQFPVTDCN